MQYVIIGVIIALSVAYAVYRLHQATRADNDPCAGCKGCALRDQMRQKQPQEGEKHHCYDKKH
jgi:hypothetical protein